MKVVLASYFFPISISRYYHKALLHMEEVEVVTVGPTSGASIPWGDEFNFPDAAFTPDFTTPSNPQAAGKYVEGLILEGLIKDVDLWIDVDAGFFVDAPMPWPHVVVATDPHCLNYDRQREMADHLFCMHKVYAKEGDHYLPYCYSEHDHFPEIRQRKWDVTVMGLQYPNRAIVAERLKAEGLDVYLKLGDIWDDYRHSICSAPICFTWSSKQDLIARVFEGLAMKRLVVTNRVPDLKRFFVEGEDLIAFSTHDEAIDKLLYYHENADEARVIAHSGHTKVQGHTYNERIRNIFSTVGL